METEWLASLKVGDEVVIRGRHDSLSRVTRFTGTQIIASRCRFRKRDGRMVAADCWNSSSLVQPTPEIRNKIRQVNLARKMGGVTWSLMPLDVLTAVDNLLPKTRSER